MITEFQKKLMEHAIRGGYRNWFGTGLDTEDSKEFSKLVGMGFATVEKAPEWSVDDVIYRLTPAGKKAIDG